MLRSYCYKLDQLEFIVDFMLSTLGWNYVYKLYMKNTINIYSNNPLQVILQTSKFCSHQTTFWYSYDWRYVAFWDQAFKETKQIVHSDEAFPGD